MSFAVFQQLTQSTVIDACLFASFTSPTASNLIVSKGDRLEVYEVKRKQNELTFAYSVPLFGRPEAMSAFRPSEDQPAQLAIAMRRARYLSVLRHSPEFGNARTCGQHVLIGADDAAGAIGSAGFRAAIAVDPAQRCLAVRVLPDRVLVFPVTSEASWKREAGLATNHGGLAFHEDKECPSGLGVPFAVGARSPLRLHHIQDFGFLHGYHKPTAVCLGQKKPAFGGCLNEANQCTSSVLVFVLDLVEKTPHLIWAWHNMPHDIMRLIPLHQPLGGVLALCKNAVIYMKEHGPSFCQTLNPNAGIGQEFSTLKGMEVKDESKLEILLTGCSSVVLSPTTLLFSVQPSGRLYLAHLVLESREVVADIVWTSPGSSSPASGLCSLNEEFVFLAAAAGGSALLKAQSSKKKLPPNLQPFKRARVGDKAEEGDEEAMEEGKKEDTKSEHLKALLAEHEALCNSGRYIRSYNLGVVDEVQALGPIQCMTPWCKEPVDDAEAEDAPEELSGTARFVCAGGSGQSGALYVCQRAVPLETLTEFDLPETTSFSAVWSFCSPSEEPMIADAATNPAGNKVDRAAAAAAAACPGAGEAPVGRERDASHRLVLVAGGFKTMLFETTEEIEEISKQTALDADGTTLCAGSVLQDRLVVQVTPQGVRFIHAHEPKAEKKLPLMPFASKAGEQRQAVGASISDPYIAVRFSDSSLRLFAIFGDEDRAELTRQLPDSARGPVVTASLFRDRNIGKTLLTVLSPGDSGTLRIFDLESMREVFAAAHLADVPPVLRNGLSAGSDQDHLRAISDPCAPVARAGAAAAKERPPPSGEAVANLTCCVEFVEVDADDVGPTLVVVLVGRPILVYRAFASPEGAQSPFPYSFSVFEHDLLGLVRTLPAGPYRPIAALPQAGGSPSGAVVAPPHPGVPALWLAARRNQLYLHPLPGKRTCSFTALNAPCCGHGFFALSASEDSDGPVAAQVLAPATVAGLSAEHGAFELRAPLPQARRPVQRTPHVLAVAPDQGLIAAAVSESVFESADPAGPSLEEDPLSEDWSIVRNAPVEFKPPPMPRMQPRFELWIDKAKDLSKLGRYKFAFDSDEHVLCMEWVTLPGFPSPSLAVGTGVNVGEDLTCRGRILIFSIEGRDPGVVPAMYQRSLKWPVTVVGQWGNYFVHSEGFKLYFEKWENTSFNKLAFFDSSMCVTAMSSIKNFLLLGDLRKGLDFVQWKEDAEKQTRDLRRLSRSPPSDFMTVLACDFVVCGKSLGLVALDHRGTAHLYQYSPHSDGREGDQVLRSCATFSMGVPCRATMRLHTEPGVQCLFMASGAGELLCLKPIDDQVYRTVATLQGMLATRLPFRCGLNPRACRHHDGPPSLIAPRKNIEDAVLLRHFAFLSTPLQTAIAEKMRLSVASLTAVALGAASCNLLSVAPPPPVTSRAVVPVADAK